MKIEKSLCMCYPTENQRGTLEINTKKKEAETINMKNEIKSVSGKKKGFIYYLKRDKWLYLMLFIPLLHIFIFKYLPMFGIIIAFEDYNIFK